MIPLESPSAYDVACTDCGGLLIVGRPAGECEVCGAVVCQFCSEHRPHHCLCNVCGEHNAIGCCRYCGQLLCGACERWECDARIESVSWCMIAVDDDEYDDISPCCLHCVREFHGQ